MLQAQPVTVQQCPATAPNLFDTLRRAASGRPAMALLFASDYLPPYRNSAAVFLGAYWDYLGSL
jgi:hypothetical protein